MQNRCSLPCLLKSRCGIMQPCLSCSAYTSKSFFTKQIGKNFARLIYILHCRVVWARVPKKKECKACIQTSPSAKLMALERAPSMCWKRMPDSARPGDQDNLVACHLFSISAAPCGWWNLYAHAKIGGRLVDRQSIEQLLLQRTGKTSERRDWEGRSE